MCNQKIEKKEKKEDLKKVIWAFKVCSGFENDKSWDRVYYARYTRQAKDLLTFLESSEAAIDCIQDIYEKLTDLGYTPGMDAIVRGAPEWKKERREKEAKRNGVFPNQSVRSMQTGQPTADSTTEQRG